MGTNYSRVRHFWRNKTTQDVRQKLLEGQFPKLGIDLIMKPDEEMDTKPLDFMRRIIAEFPLNIILSGEEQSGKTYSAIWTAKTLLEERKIYNPVFVRASEIRKERTDIGWDFPFNRNADLIVLDDLGTESMVQELVQSENSDKKGLIFQLIDYRTSEMLPMIITTNLNREELTARYSVKTVARLENNGTIKEFLEEERMANP